MTSPRTSPFLLAWLVLSFLLNLSGIASIVDGFVVWADFIRNFLAFYRGWVREPVLAIFNAMLPVGWQLPTWSGDLLAIWMAFFLVDNIDTVFTLGQTSIGFSIRSEGLARGLALSLARFLFFPVILLVSITDLATGKMKSRYYIRNLGWQLSIFALVVATFVVLLFINFQILKHVG